MAVENHSPTGSEGQVLFMLGSSYPGKRFSLHHRKLNETAEDEKEKSTAEHPDKGYSSVHALILYFDLGAFGDSPPP
jgi:hypothetical protein